MDHPNISYNDDSFSRERSKWLLLGSLFLVALIIGLTAFVINDQREIASTSQVEKLAQTPKKYYGDQVSVTGNVSSVIGSRAFTLEGPGIISDEVLVISKQPTVPVGGGDDEVLYNRGTRVSLHGEARKFNLKQLEDELEVDLVDSEFERWEGKPVIVADGIKEDL